MKNFSPLFVAMFGLCAMGLWGCGQQKAGAINTKVRELETRHAKLEDDFRTLQATHEQMREKLSEAETQRGALEKQKTELTANLDGVILERENLRKQMTQRTQERDHAQTNLMQFSKDLQNLASRVDAAVNSSPQSPSAAIIPASRSTRNE